MKNKPNPFLVSHLNIEEQLRNIESQLNLLYKDDADIVLEVYNKIKYAIRAIDKQDTKTMSVVLAALTEYEPSVVHAFGDHQLVSRIMGQTMLEKAEAFFLSNSTSEKAAAIAALIHYFNKYSSTLHEDINREEVTLLPLLLRYCNEEEMVLIQMQVEQALTAQNLLTLVPEPCVQ